LWLKLILNTEIGVNAKVTIKSSWDNCNLKNTHLCTNQLKNLYIIPIDNLIKNYWDYMKQFITSEQTSMPLEASFDLSLLVTIFSDHTPVLTWPWHQWKMWLCLVSIPSRWSNSPREMCGDSYGNLTISISLTLYSLMFSQVYLLRMRRMKQMDFLGALFSSCTWNYGFIWALILNCLNKCNFLTAYHQTYAQQSLRTMC